MELSKALGVCEVSRAKGREERWADGVSNLMACLDETGSRLASGFI